METYLNQEFTRIGHEITKQLEKMRRKLPAAQEDIELLDFLFRQYKNTKECERSLQIQATSSTGEVFTSNEEFSTSTEHPNEVKTSTATEPTASEPTKPESLTKELTKRKRASKLAAEKAPVDSHSPKKKSKSKGTQPTRAKSSETGMPPTKTIPKNISAKQKHAKLLSCETHLQSKFFYVKEANGAFKKYFGRNIRTSKKPSRFHERNTLKVTCIVKKCTGGHILKVLHPPAMIRSFMDTKNTERKVLDVEMEETDNPRNYEILPFFEEHTCTDSVVAPIIIPSDEESDSDEEPQPERRPQKTFGIFIKKEKEG